MDNPEDRVPCEDFASCGAAQFQNRQYIKNVKQQDSYFVVEDIGATFGVQLGHAQRVSLYGVADGHGEFGEISAAFVRRNLPLQVAQSPHFAAGRLNDALLEAFTQTELLQQTAGLPLWASGACVLVAAVSPTHVFVANCGDCRCVLSDQGSAQDLSNDHNIERATPEEIQRILNSGGTITPDKRVTVAGAPGRLATTRSLGDYWAKPQGPPEKHIISGLPEIRVVPRSPSQQYLVLASDGIFGFMESQDVVSLCINAANQAGPSGPLSRLAHTVLCTAVHARRSDDNCTCLVVDLTRIQAQAQLQPGPEPSLRLVAPGDGFGDDMANAAPQTPTMPSSASRLDDHVAEKSPKDDSDVSLSSLVAPDEVCWCPWCWRQNRDGRPEKVILGSMEKWRIHMHDQHFDKLGGAYGPDEVVPCYWCCRPCVTKKGQGRSWNRLPFWGSHERVCKENPNKPALPSQAARSTGSSSKSSELPRHDGSCVGQRRPQPSPQSSHRSIPSRQHQDFRGGYPSGASSTRGGGASRQRPVDEALADDSSFAYTPSRSRLGSPPPLPATPVSSHYGGDMSACGGRGTPMVSPGAPARASAPALATPGSRSAASGRRAL